MTVLQRLVENLSPRNRERASENLIYPSVLEP